MVSLPLEIVHTKEQRQMYCYNCGRQNLGQANYCENCGSALKNIEQPFQAHHSTKYQYSTPTAVIVITWVLVLISFFPLSLMSRLLNSIVVLVSAIWLVRSRNGIARTNGWIVLVLWIITFLVGFWNAISTTI